MEGTPEILDRIYEGAFRLEAWIEAIDLIAPRIGAISGTVVHFEKSGEAPTCWASACITGVVEQWLEDGLWKSETMAPKLECASRGASAIQNKQDFVSRRAWEADPTSKLFRRAGIDHQLFAPIHVSSTGPVLISFERQKKLGRFEEHCYAAPIGTLLPHFSRAAALARRFAMEWGRVASSALENVDVAAAVLSKDLAIITANSSFLGLDLIRHDAAFGRVRFRTPLNENAFLKACRDVQMGARMSGFAVTDHGSEGGCVFNLTRLVRDARHIYAGGEFLLTAKTTANDMPRAHAGAIAKLFNLSPAEARLAVALAEGRTLAEAARGNGLTIKSARTYLDRIFAKTGCHRQAELILFIKAAAATGA